MADYSEIHRCRGCHAERGDMETVMTMDPMPLAGQFCKRRDDALAAKRFPLTWVFCRHCGLVQVAEDVSGENLFETYNYASSTVGGLVRHFEGFSRFLQQQHSDSPDLSFLEIGCNDGVLLNRLPDNWNKLGVDPSDVASRASAENEGYDLVSAPFTAELVRERGWVERWDVVSGSNCLAHISDLRDVFAGVYEALKLGGWFWIEVHDLDALLQGSQWDTIYHEHKVEWSGGSLKRCVELCGFRLNHEERTPLHGGALRFGFRKTGAPVALEDGGLMVACGLAELADAYRNRGEVPAVSELLAAKQAGARIAAYGAAGRANVYLNQMRPLAFEFIVDEAPLRMNHFIPSVGTPIVPPSQLIVDQPDYCLITAWNYRDDIIAKNPEYRGKWLTAFPVN